MKHKIILALVAVVALISTIPAQSQIRWAATAGAGQGNLLFKQDLVTVKPTVGFQAGVLGELMFPGIGFGIDVGLLYNQQGAKVALGQREVWSSLGYGDKAVMIHNINIPVHVRFKYTRLNGLEDIIAPLVYGGPEFDIQVGHSGKDDGAYKFSGGDLGLTCGGGVELYKRWQITGQYTWGMTYVLKTMLLDNYSARSRQWTVRVSYFF